MSAEVLQRPTKSKTLEMNAKNTITLPFSEILRIKNACNLNEDPEKEKKIKEKLELNDKSKGRVKNWPNTLEAKRKKKDEARFERFKEDEEERRKIDKEEAEYQAQIKKTIIEKANKQIYEQNDKVKGLQGKMLLSDALLEREGQVEINRRKKEMEKTLEKHFNELALEKIAEDENLEKERENLEREKKLHVKQIIKEQHDEMKSKLIKRIQEDKIEGEIIKRKDIQAQKDQMREEEERRLKHMKNNDEAKRGNEVLIEIKKQLKEKEIEEDKKIERFAKKKEEMLQMRKMREEIKFREKQNERQRLIDAQVEKLQQLKNMEDDRINKQIVEAQVRAEEIEKEKREKIAQMKANIDESLKLSLAKKQRDGENDKIASNKYQVFWKQKNVDLQDQEAKEKSEYRQRCKDLANFHKLQADEKTKIREEQFLKELEESEKIKTFLDLEDKTFNSWAERCINEWQEAGKNIKPLLLQLQKYKKIGLE